jgi:hypothetical protein
MSVNGMSIRSLAEDEVNLRSLHDYGHTSGLDGLFHGKGYLPREPLLDLQPTTECFGYSGELGDAEHELAWDVRNGDLYGEKEGYVSLRVPNASVTQRLNAEKKRTQTLPVKGTRWCSHKLEMSISRTMTISSWSSAKMASLITSATTRSISQLAVSGSELI